MAKEQKKTTRTVNTPPTPSVSPPMAPEGPGANTGTLGPGTRSNWIYEPHPEAGAPGQWDNTGTLARGVPTAAYSAPPMFRNQFRKQLGRTPIADQTGVITPLPIPLPQIARDYGPLVEQLKQLMQERYANLPADQRSGYFHQGFEQYPEAMAQMVVRRALNNRLTAQGDVAKWMQTVNERLGNA